MIGDGERELEPAPKKCVFHKVENLDRPPSQSAANPRIVPIIGDGHRVKQWIAGPPVRTKWWQKCSHAIQGIGFSANNLATIAESRYARTSRIILFLKMQTQQ
jgi:hypothetical protein